MQHSLSLFPSLNIFDSVSSQQKKSIQYNLFLFPSSNIFILAVTFGQVVSKKKLKTTHNAVTQSQTPRNSPYISEKCGFKLEPIEQHDRLVAYPPSIQCISGTYSRGRSQPTKIQDNENERWHAPFSQRDSRAVIIADDLRKCNGRYKMHRSHSRSFPLFSLAARSIHIHTHTSVLLSSREFVSHERSHDFRALVQVSLSPPLLAWLGLDREKRKRNGRVVRPVLAPFFFSTTCVERALNKSWPPNRKLSLGFADSRKKFNCY